MPRWTSHGDIHLTGLIGVLEPDSRARSWPRSGLSPNLPHEVEVEFEVYAEAVGGTSSSGSGRSIDHPQHTSWVGHLSGLGSVVAEGGRREPQELICQLDLARSAMPADAGLVGQSFRSKVRRRNPPGPTRWSSRGSGSHQDRTLPWSAGADCPPGPSRGLERRSWPWSSPAPTGPGRNCGFLGSDGGVTEVRKEAERGLRLGTDGVLHSLIEGRAVPSDDHDLQMSSTATEQAVQQRES
jgi:hypothetical protein